MPRLTERLEVRLTPEMKEELDQQAHERVVSAGAIIRDALRRQFEQWAKFERSGRGAG